MIAMTLLIILAVPGDVISIDAEMTYTIRATTAMVVRSTLHDGVVYACNPVIRWRDPAGQWHTWIDPCLAGVLVRWQRPDGVWTDGIVDRQGIIWRDGSSHIRLDEQPQMIPATRRDRLPWDWR